MFRFFTKKTPDPIAKFKQLAEEAEIDVVYKEGNYCAFLIHIDSAGGQPLGRTCEIRPPDKFL